MLKQSINMALTFVSEFGFDYELPIIFNWYSVVGSYHHLVKDICVWAKGCEFEPRYGQCVVNLGK